MIADACCHGRCHAQGLLNAAEVLMHEVQRHRVLKVLDLLAEAVGQAGEPAHAHAHGQVLALHVAGGRLVHVGLTHDVALLGIDEL